MVNLDILLKASAILLVSLSAVGADKLDEPKLLKSKAKNKFNTYYENNNVFKRSLNVIDFISINTYDKISNNNGCEEKWNT